MSACTFFGHRDCPSSIKPKLREVLIDLIENHAVDMFYVGQQGAFDGIVRSVLKELGRYTPTSVMPSFWRVCPQNETSLIPAITLIPCSQKASKLSTLASLSHGATSG